MATSDPTEYLRSKQAERGEATLRNPTFMKDGFDEWAESTRPTHFGGLEREAAPESMPSMGGAMTITQAKKLRRMVGGSQCAMMGSAKVVAAHQLQGGVLNMKQIRDFLKKIPLPTQQLKGGANVQEILALVKKTRQFLQDFLKWVDDVEFDLVNNIAFPQNEDGSYKKWSPTNLPPDNSVPGVALIIASYLEQVKGWRSIAQTVLSLAEAVGLGKQKRGGVSLELPEWAKRAVEIGQQVYSFYQWFDANKSSIYYILERPVMQPYGKMAVDALKTVFGGETGSGRGGAKLSCCCNKMPRCMCGGATRMVRNMMRPMLEDERYSMATVGSAAPSPAEMEAMRLPGQVSGLGRRRGGRAAPMPRDYGEVSEGRMPMGMARAHKKSPPSIVMPMGMGGAKRSNPRAAIVKRVMQEQGLSLPQASKYVKDHGLY
jgi:hypothetical protein